ncbi:putative mucin/carbohydrate-binding domain-containing protein [Listeria goaensis]|uniref:putative mucin/carbohydrate-binding domain-containing protein n=1 Tax=Listeria goaensis TaxID=1649188 RepID=UPI000B58B423|nr:putative mucin/carbohydrate-binding domain-containing protein [Listeria goaensis]
MKKILFGMLLFCLAMVVSVQVSYANGVNTKHIFSIEDPTWIRNSGMSKGVNHDRQDLGFILQAGKVLKVRQTNPNFGRTLKLSLLGNDSQFEKSVNVGTNWVTISSSKSLVPFIDTPFGDTSATIQYEVVSNEAQKPLPTYKSQNSERDFFRMWDQFNSEYALVQGKDFQLFVPKGDKEKLRNMRDFNSLDALIGHYEKLFKMYNQIAGFDGLTAYNKNSANRYFLKADANGPGGAYYSWNWTAMTSPSIESWLKEADWGQLHEIGHGYQAGFDSKGMYTGEVFNNLYGVQYQYEHYGKAADKNGWLFDYGNKKAVEEGLYESLIEKNGTYESVGLREKLILLTMLRQKAGNDALPAMYQGYRKAANEPDFNPEAYALPDLFNEYYSQYSQLDFSPVLEKWGLTLSGNQEFVNRAKGYPAVASLAHIVPKDKLASARNLLDAKLLITSNFEMVKNEEIASLDLKGDLTLTLKADNISDLVGSKIRLKDGTRTVQEKVISNGSMTFTSVPNGVYSLEVVGSQADKYDVKTSYVYVKEAKNNANISLTKINKSFIGNQTIQFLGLSNQPFASFQTDVNQGIAKLSVVSSTPHSYFENRKYAEITVKNASGAVRYHKIINGTNASTGIDEFAFREGDRVEVYHAETAGRLVSKESIVDSSRSDNVWVMTKWGLKNQQLQNNAEQDFQKKVVAIGDALLKDETMKAAPLSLVEGKKHLLVAIQSLTEPAKTEYLQKYKNLFPGKEEKNFVNDYVYTFKGWGNHLIATMNVSPKDMQATVAINANMPHSYFASSYASITILDRNGLEKYTKDFVGTTNYPASTTQIHLAEGDYIKVTHKESGSRLTIQEKTHQTFLKKGDLITYRVTNTGLEEVSTSEIPVPKAAGYDFQYVLKGLSNHVVATMNVSLTDMQATILVTGNRPHDYFTASYAAIDIADKNGTRKYRQDYYGTTDYPTKTTRINLAEGDRIKVSHREAASRLTIQNMQNGSLLEKTNLTTVYIVKKTGLELVK